ncbi:hypothetical protein PEX1_023550 [Penicillium expansum]|uniref:F-box domain-containing protein n=1 Tax=Penicillium expansum TaxID=27334 RepID=A0A0A2K4W6_PENEN|nr:hypothetical protein PEX2_013040 [Penicillium expansum]KGO62091.1 hypothetical protein PEX2_013040 [Penicillium expansum]KGO72195.1 hypothetical protein PEX1_023550 [Penicillium expansum]
MSYWLLLSSSGLRDPSSQKTKTSNQKKLAFRPPSLKLLKKPFGLETKVTAIQGTVSGQSSLTVNKDLQTMPVRADTAHGPSGAVPRVPGKHMAAETKKTQGQSHHLGLKEEDIASGGHGDTRSASPQKSLDTMVDLESPQDSEDDSEISPLSDYPHPLLSASRLVRFFPELSSHFAVVSPVSADSTMDRSTGPSFFERELEERVQTLYRGSADVAPDAHRSADQPQITLTSSGSDETLDCASSCYSRRTSVTSVGSTFWGDDGQHPHKTADAFSIYSPVAAGVFDDARSICSSRPSSIVAPCHLHVSKLAHPIPITKKASMNDLKNKPLPLEPSFGPSSAPDRSDDSPLSAISPRVRSQWSTQFSKRDSLSSLQHSTTVSHGDWKHSMLHQLNNQRESQHLCHTCGHSQRQPQRRGRQRSDLVVAGHRARHVPTLSQAAEELEDALAGLTDQDLSHKTLLILDGPLQISRHNGDLIATRPAPLPPSTKPHSETSQGKSTLKNSRINTIKSIGPSPAKEKSHKLSKREAKDRRSGRDKEKEMDEKANAKNPLTSKETIRKTKSKKSFLAFRKQSPAPHNAVSVNSRSEDSLNITLEAHSSPTRDSLLHQLPRLQTNDLRNPFDHVAEQAALSGSLGPAVNLEEKPIASKTRQSWALVSTAQGSSVQLTEQIYELPATPPSPLSTVPSEARRNAPLSIPLPEDMPLDLILSIMQNIDSLDDLFNFALVNKKIYNAFKGRELPMLKNALFKMSPPAWEMREMSPPWEMEWQLLVDPDSQVPEYTPTLYLQRYAQDIYTLAKLKALVLARCAPFLRRDTIRGLAGVDNTRAGEVDDAFWRLWTFCRIFGCGKGRENDLAGQMDWLKGGVQAKNHFTSASTMTQPFGMNNVLFEPPEGFGRGNLSGLSQKQMYDLTEIWTCMGVLLQPLHGKCIEARKVGIFDDMNVPDGDLAREETVLEEWTSYILTLGLGAVLTLSAVCPADTTAATFIKAKSIGLAKWESTETEASRSSFLKEAVSRAYDLQDRALDSPTDISPQKTSPTENDRAIRERQAGFAHELRCRRQRGLDPDPKGRFSFSAERPMSEFSTIVHNLNASLRDHRPIPSVPALVLDRSSTSTAGTAPQTPTHPSDPAGFFTSSHTQPPAMMPLPLRPQVLDPVDRAIDMMVNELGFNTQDAKWALKITDTGEGIDATAAVQLLQHQRQKNERNPFGQGDILLSDVIKRQKSRDSGWRWA